jgi:D-3-phosphoglycerate dehydrogenase
MNPKVVITDFPWPGHSVEEEILGEIGAEVIRADCKTAHDVITVARNADALMVGWAPITREVIEKLDHCKMISRYGTGVEMIDLEAARQRGIGVVSNSDYCIMEVASQALAFLLACSRKLHIASSALRSGYWDVIEIMAPVVPLSEQTLGIMGFGRIGRQMAELTNPLVGQIIVHDPCLPVDYALPEGLKRVSFDSLLSDSDYISIHCPLNLTTRGIFSSEAFAKMKSTAFLINVARGPVVDEEALLDALENGRITGAALDVFSQEPLSKEHPLLKRPNVLATPHVAWYSERSRYLLRANTARAVVKFFKGESLPLLNTCAPDRVGLII